ncbi:MAG: DUF1592 domain-containing protein [Myxococcales bacterium]|nr:MAG: DUF1592 domain-containing protein [Myxococcales bacterium]
MDISAQASSFPADPVVEGFSNNADFLTISDAHATQYMNIAEYVADAAIQNATLLAHFTGGCDVQQTACIQTFTQNLGKVVYRRPLSEEEIGNFMTLGATADSNGALEKVRVVVEAMLQSPFFVFRVEYGQENGERPQLRKLDPYEIISRLSFLLWQKGPSEALLDRVDGLDLSSVEGISALTTEMLQDSASEEVRWHFSKQWLRMDTLEGKSLPDNESFSSALVTSAIEEVQLLNRDALGSGGDVRSLLNARYGYADSLLADIYEVSAPSTTSLQKVNYDESSLRGGLFSTAAFSMLTTNSQGGVTSFTRRGAYIRDAFLCDPLPAPPPGAEALTEVNRLEDPTCSGCHVKVDLIGHGLEMFDALGKQRSSYANGDPVITAGSIDGLDDPDFSGAAQLGTKIGDQPQFSECVVDHYLRWALGKILEDEYDGCTVDIISRDLISKSYDFNSMILQLVTSDAFRYRTALQ